MEYIVWTLLLLTRFYILNQMTRDFIFIAIYYFSDQPEHFLLRNHEIIYVTLVIYLFTVLKVEKCGCLAYPRLRHHCLHFVVSDQYQFWTNRSSRHLTLPWTVLTSCRCFDLVASSGHVTTLWFVGSLFTREMMMTIFTIFANDLAFVLNVTVFIYKNCSQLLVTVFSVDQLMVPINGRYILDDSLWYKHWRC